MQLFKLIRQIRLIIYLPQISIHQKRSRAKDMSETKYSTIDPLIMESLNLNEKRMNHIFDILHERPDKSKKLNVIQGKKKFSFEDILREDTKKDLRLLPVIVRRNQVIQSSNFNKNSNKQRRYRTIDNSRSIITKSQKQSINHNKPISKSINKSINNSTDKSVEALVIRQHGNLLGKKSRVKSRKNNTIDMVSLINYDKEYSVKEEYLFKNPKSQRNPTRNSLSAVRSKITHSKLSAVQSPSLQQLSPSTNNNHQQSQRILQESLLPSALLKKQNQIQINKNKRKQMINDYMGEFALRKSKSMVINSKDVYRMEIQKIVAELTPIQKLEQSEKKMKRIKKRHQHLLKFDQKYYSKLNQIELLEL